jgi:hypothetical protein
VINTIEKYGLPKCEDCLYVRDKSECKTCINRSNFTGSCHVCMFDRQDPNAKNSVCLTCLFKNVDLFEKVM